MTSFKTVNLHVNFADIGFRDETFSIKLMNFGV